MSEKASKKSSTQTPASSSSPREPFKPAKFSTYDRQVVDYVKTSTAKNIWYYRYESFPLLCGQRGRNKEEDCILAWTGIY